MEQDTKTFAQVAIEASKAFMDKNGTGCIGWLVFTGNILIKEGYEDKVFPADGDRTALESGFRLPSSEVLAPEFTVFGIVAAALLPDADLNGPRQNVAATTNRTKKLWRELNTKAFNGGIKVARYGPRGKITE